MPKIQGGAKVVGKGSSVGGMKKQPQKLMPVAVSYNGDLRISGIQLQSLLLVIFLHVLVHLLFLTSSNDLSLPMTS